MDPEKYAEAAQLVLEEAMRAREKFPPFNSGHEGWAVLYEEVLEMFDAIRANRPIEARMEARQVAAMAICFMVETR